MFDCDITRLALLSNYPVLLTKERERVVVLDLVVRVVVGEVRTNWTKFQNDESPCPQCENVDVNCDSFLDSQFLFQVFPYETKTTFTLVFFLLQFCLCTEGKKKKKTKLQKINQLRKIRFSVRWLCHLSDISF